MRLIKPITIVALVSLVVGLFVFFIGLNYKGGQLESSTIVELRKGEGLSVLSSKLKHQDVISSKLLFKVYAVILGYKEKLKAGEYKISSDMSILDILSNISEGKVIYRKITIPEGLTLKEIKEILNSNDGLSGDVSLDVEEGYLLPETYSFQKNDSKDSFLKQMNNAMTKELDRIWESRDKKIDKYIKSKKDLVTLASIVEKETLIDVEKPIVAGVYLNRLKINMRLQADPTVIYGAKDYKGNITYKMLRDKNEYNTYVIYGLPKTAIANPGIESLKAVAHPADVEYLYFVADGLGGHVFSKTYEEHKVKVQDYLKVRRQQGHIK